MKELPSKLILFSFFDRLRKLEGLELDMTQYFLFLDLFTRGFAKEKAALLHLCKTLWLTRSKFRENFEEFFEEEFQNLERQWLPVHKTGLNPNSSKNDQMLIETSNSTIPENLTDTTKTSISPKDKNPISHQIEKEDQSKSAKRNISQNLMEVFLNFGEGGSKSPLTGSKSDEMPSEKATTFLFSEEKHLPIQMRRLGQILLKLQMFQNTHWGDQLDLPAIVRQFGKDGFITQLNFEKISKNCHQAIFLTDHEGSMAAFELWGDFLFRILTHHPAFERVDRYYFHDSPAKVINKYGMETFKLFTNSSHTISTHADQIFNLADPRSTWLIIFSDGGAYKQELDHEGLLIWWQFLGMASKQVSAVTWLNPLPKDRWEGSMAGYLSHIAPMVSFDHKGIRLAVKKANHANRNRTT